MTPYQNQIAIQASTETDSEKLQALITELSRSLDSERVKLDSIGPSQSNFDVLT
jgi:hypothetical protein